MDEEAEKEIGKILRKAADKRRGYADFYHWPEKRTKEWGIVTTLCESLEKEEGLHLHWVQSVDD